MTGVEPATRAAVTDSFTGMDGAAGHYSRVSGATRTSMTLLTRPEWTCPASNRKPSVCKADALPIEHIGLNAGYWTRTSMQPRSVAPRRLQILSRQKLAVAGCGDHTTAGVAIPLLRLHVVAGGTSPVQLSAPDAG